METKKPKGYYFDKTGEKIEVTKNLSGIVPVEDKLLLLPDEPAEVIRGIHKPEQVQAQERMAQVRALLIATGGNCFEDWDGPIPEVGDRVMGVKYAGIFDIDGQDGRKYQICTARDIVAIITLEDYKPETLSPRKALGKQDSDTLGSIS
jgi:co-chaperonin GroES (HSP10)